MDKRGVLAALILTVDAVAWLKAFQVGWYWPPLGIDLRTYLDATRSWLAGDGFYHAWQLAGAYGAEGQPILYPPVALWLFVPFTVLPAFLWWAPLLALRVPRRWWSVAIGLLLWPQTIALVLAGNPVIWCAGFVALGLSPLVMIKPTLFPFALSGFGTRQWWISAGLLSLACIPFGAMWLDYATVLRNATTEQGPWYIFGNVPLLIVAVLARGGLGRGAFGGATIARGSLRDGRAELHRERPTG